MERTNEPTAATGMARGLRVQVFLGETEQVGRSPRYQAILEYLRREGAAGATVVRGIAGFGANSKIKTAAILRLSLDLPVVVTWIDAPERVDRLLPGVRDLAGSGIVTVEELGIVAYGGRHLEQLRFDLPVVDVMRRDIVEADADLSVREAVERLVGRDFRSLPVVDRDGRPIGILANTDLLERGGLTARLELLDAMPGDERQRVLDALPDRPVREVMHRDPRTIRDNATVGQAARVMSENRLKRVPVVDGSGRLVGIISRADILHAIAESFPREAAEHPEHPGARTAGELMRTDAPTVTSDAPLDAVVDAVASTRLNRAVVLDTDRRVVGIVTDADVLRSAEPAARTGVGGALMRMGGGAAGKATASDLMRRDVPTVLASASLADAARVMVSQARKILPVVDEDGRLLGVLDRADLLHAAAAALGELGSLGPVGDIAPGDGHEDEDG